MHYANDRPYQKSRCRQIRANSDLPSSMVERLPKLFVRLSMLLVGDERPDAKVDEPRSDPESVCKISTVRHRDRSFMPCSCETWSAEKIGRRPAPRGPPPLPLRRCRRRPLLEPLVLLPSPDRLATSMAQPHQASMRRLVRSCVAKDECECLAACSRTKLGHARSRHLVSPPLWCSPLPECI